MTGSSCHLDIERRTRVEPKICRAQEKHGGNARDGLLRRGGGDGRDFEGGYPTAEAYKGSIILTRFTC